MMKLTYEQSATVVIEDKDTKIMCDPWLTDGIYYGSWAQYPPYDFKPEKFDDVDYIYVSHIHPDHCAPETLTALRKDIPILIHEFPAKFLKNYLERFGFQIIELSHNKRTSLKNNLHINILAADDCDPTICGQLFACNFDQAKYGTNQIDTMCVIDNGEEVVVNANDCPFEIAKFVSSRVSKDYPNIDLLLVGYSGAASYPHCYELSREEKMKAADKKKQLRLNNAVDYINLFKPKYYMPFAGRYSLCGKFTDYNDYTGQPELDEAFDFLASKIDQKKHRGFLLNSGSIFDIKMGKASDSYKRINPKEKSEYLKNVLSKRKMVYEGEPNPQKKQILDLIPAAYERFERTRKKMGFNSDTTILLDIWDDEVLKLSCNGNGYELIPKDEEKSINKFIKMSLDNKLLFWILQGPKKAHWNNADISSHIKWKRNPNVYERGIYHCLNFFHA